MTQSGASSQLATGWALLGLAAAGTKPGPAALGYVKRGLGSLTAIGDVERTVLVVRAAGQDPRKFGGRNLIDDILRHRRSDGSFDGYVSYTSFAIFALRRSGASPTDVASAARWIERHQNADGGFNVGGRGRERDRRHRLRRPGAQARRADRRRAPRRDVPRPPAERQRRLPADARRGAERAVDGLRRPGPGRRGRPRERGQEGPGLPALADRAERARALLTHRAPDAGLGVGAGAHGAASPDLLAR